MVIFRKKRKYEPIYVKMSPTDKVDDIFTSFPYYEKEVGILSIEMTGRKDKKLGKNKIEPGLMGIEIGDSVFIELGINDEIKYMEILASRRQWEIIEEPIIPDRFFDARVFFVSRKLYNFEPNFYTNSEKDQLLIKLSKENIFEIYRIAKNLYLEIFEKKILIGIRILEIKEENPFGIIF